MLETLAVVTFLLANGTKSIVPVFPPGGEYHLQFGFMCERNKSRVVEQVRTLVREKKILTPDGAQHILNIKVYCSRTIKI
jgi:hypothetical protein